MTEKTRSEQRTDYADNTVGAIAGSTHQNFVDSALFGTRATYDDDVTLTTDDSIVFLDGTNNTVAAALPASGNLLLIKAINIDNAVTLTGAITGSPYTFATAGDAVILAWDGSTWQILSEYLNA